MMHNEIMINHMQKDFFKLCDVLQKVHTSNTNMTGIVNIKRGNILAHILCFMLRLPKENNASHLHVQLEHTKNTMTWKRTFDNLKMTSSFTLKNARLIEKLGMFNLHVNAIEKNGGLNYQFYRTDFLGVKVPQWLSPKITAFEQNNNGNYEFSVTVNIFLIGFLISYAGILTIQ